MLASAVAIEKALGEALRLHQSGHHVEAEAAYREVIARAPDHPHARHFYGMLCHEQGRLDEAIGNLEIALAALPELVEARSNLGNLYLIAGRLDDGERAFRRALVDAPDAQATHFNLGMLLLRTKRFEEAVVELEASCANAPDADTFVALGDAHRATKDFEAAVRRYNQALALRPGDGSVVQRLCSAYFALLDAADRSLSDTGSAVKHLEHWLELAPDDPIARHTLAAYSGRDTPARCSVEYVQRTFDLFADSFDEVLGKIGYQGVVRSAEALRDALEGSSPDRAGKPVVLDAGCGTGALGPIVRPWCGRLVGVDLSEKMVGKTRARGVYDEVHQEDLVAFLAAHPATFDAIVCADTFIYFGELEEPIAAAIAALRPGGRFVFTAEELVGIEDAQGYRLDRHGRYAHRETYVEKAIVRAGGSVSRVGRVDAFRVEFGAAVSGIVFTATR